MQDNFIMSPKVDYCFKELMQDPQVRAGFLSAVLNIPLEDIKETVLLDTHLRKMTEEEKLGILDVRILLNNESEVDIEIQVSYFAEWRKRSLFYWSKMFSESIKEGEPYSKLRPCVSISILDFTLLQDTGRGDYYSCYQLCETSRHTVFTDLIKFYIIELPKLPSEIKETNDIYLWSKFIASEKKEEMEMLANENKQIDQAYRHLQVMSKDEEKRMEYEARQRYIRDMLSLQEQYKEEGRLEEKKDIAISLKGLLDEKTIAETTGLPLEVIQEL